MSYTEEEAAEGYTHVLGTAKDTAVRLTGLYAERIAPRIQPAHVEEQILLPLPSFSYDMLGYVDVITDDRRVVDFKTTTKSFPSDAADKSEQLTWYGILAKRILGDWPGSLELNVVIGKKTPDVQVFSTKRDDDCIAGFTRRINNVVKGINAGVYMHSDPELHWWCNKKWCGYTGICPYFNG